MSYRVLAQTKHSGTRQDDLVHEVQHVRDKQQRDNDPINLAHHATRNSGIRARLYRSRSLSRRSHLADGVSRVAQQRLRFAGCGCMLAAHRMQGPERVFNMHPENGRTAGRCKPPSVNLSAGCVSPHAYLELFILDETTR